MSTYNQLKDNIDENEDVDVVRTKYNVINKSEPTLMLVGNPPREWRDENQGGRIKLFFDCVCIMGEVRIRGGREISEATVEKPIELCSLSAMADSPLVKTIAQIDKKNDGLTNVVIKIVSVKSQATGYFYNKAEEIPIKEAKKLVKNIKTD